MKIACLVALILAVFALSCAKAEPPILAGSSWKLLALGENGKLETPSTDTPIILEFLNNGTGYSTVAA